MLENTGIMGSGTPVTPKYLGATNMGALSVSITTLVDDLSKAASVHEVAFSRDAKRAASIVYRGESCTVHL